MRLLWARVGVPYSPATGLPIESQTVSQMVDRVLALPEGTRLYLLAPVVRGRKGEYRKELADYMKRGFQRVKIDGRFYEIAEAPDARQEVQARHRRGGGPPRGAARHRNPARGIVRDRAAARRRLGGGGIRRTRPAPLRRVRRPERRSAKIHDQSGPERLIFSEKFACAGVWLHHSRGRAAAVLVQQPVRRLPGLWRAWRRAAYRRRPGHSRQGQDLARRRDRAVGEIDLAPITSRRCRRLGKHYKFTLDTKWKDLPKKTQDALLHGSGEDTIQLRL